MGKRRKRKRTPAQIAADALRTGRPSKGDDARTIPVMVKVSANELREWRRAAKEAGMSLSAWLLAPRRKG
jgi:hypothetical protein